MVIASKVVVLTCGQYIGNVTPVRAHVLLILYKYCLNGERRGVAPSPNPRRNQESWMQQCYSRVQWSTLHYTTVQHSTVQYIAIQYSELKCSTVQHSTLKYSILHYSTVCYIQMSNITKNSVHTTIITLPVVPPCPAWSFHRQLIADCGVMSAMTATSAGKSKFEFLAETCFFQVGLQTRYFHFETKRIVLWCEL